MQKTSDFVTNIINTVPVRPGYRTVRVSLRSAKSDTLTFCAASTYSIVCRNGCLVDVVDLLVKNGPKNETLRSCIPVNDLFRRECLFHNVVLPELRTAGAFQSVPSLIAANLDDGGEALVLATSSASAKFETWVGELTSAHIRLVLERLARFQALNFVYGVVKPEQYEKLKVELRGGYLACLNNKQTIRIIRANCRDCSRFFGDGVAQKLRRFADQLEVIWENVRNGADRLQVLVNGCFTSNFLFSYEKYDNRSVPSNVQITNWQLVQFGSPALDLSLFLFTNLEDFGDLEELLKYYYSNLKKCLRDSDCDVEEFMSAERFHKEWLESAKYGLALAFFVLKFDCLESSKRPNVNAENLSCEDFLEPFVKEPNGEFVRRIRCVVEYCVNSGVL